MTGYHPRSTAQRRRVDLILAVLADAPHPKTTKEVARAIGESYSATYNTLRKLAHGASMPYADMVGDVNQPGYPVIWHSWFAGDAVGHVTWELTPEARDERVHEAAMLEAAFQSPAVGEAGA